MSEKILIVDDDIESLKLIGLMLQRHGFTVFAANSGIQALAKIKAEPPDLVILDVMMPDMNGYEVCKRIRAMPELRQIPILMFTAKTLIDDKVAGFEAGADDYLTKPTHPAELTARIRTMLARTTPQAPKPALGGRSIGILGSKGGIGTTTLALSLAAAALRTEKRPIVADLHLGTGGVGLQLGITDNSGLANVLNATPENRHQTLNRELLPHESGIRLLLGSANPKEAQMGLAPETASALVGGLKTLGDVVICDLGTRYTAVNQKLISTLDRVLIYIEPLEPSLIAAQNLIKAIKGDSQKKVDLVVINRTAAKPQVAWHDVETRLGQELLSIVAYVPEVALQAQEAHQPIVSFKPSAIFSSQMVKLAEDVTA